MKNISELSTEQEQAELLGEQQEQGKPSTVWPEPTALPSYELPNFPIEALPIWLRDQCKALASATQTPIDVAGMLSLSVISTGIAKKVIVRLREDWDEPTCTFIAVALNSGERKSPVFAAMVKPIEDFEQTEVERIAPLVAETQSRKKILE